VSPNSLPILLFESKIIGSPSRVLRSRKEEGLYRMILSIGCMLNRMSVGGMFFGKKILLLRIKD
jgi:hypothetical protein